MMTRATSKLLYSGFLVWVSASCGEPSAGDSQGDTVCAALFNNNCERGCECPEQYDCYIVDRGGLGTGAGQHYCLKPCNGQEECPAGQLCTSVHISLTGGTEKIEGRCPFLL